jgi:hypothetical protein
MSKLSPKVLITAENFENNLTLDEADYIVKEDEPKLINGGGVYFTADSSHGAKLRNMGMNCGLLCGTHNSEIPMINTGKEKCTQKIAF